MQYLSHDSTSMFFLARNSIFGSQVHVILSSSQLIDMQVHSEGLELEHVTVG